MEEEPSSAPSVPQADFPDPDTRWARARRFIFCGLFFGILSACTSVPPPDEIPGCQQRIDLVRDMPQDDAVRQRFGAVCTLERQPDLDFGNGLSAYICGVFYPSVQQRAKEVQANLTVALGPLGPAPEFTSDLLGRETGPFGWAHDIVLLADAHGEVVSIVTTRAQLVTLQAVRSTRAAARLVGLGGQLDRTEQTWLCNGGAYRSDAGWTFPAVPENCETWGRDISVSAKGEINVGPPKETNRIVCGQYD